LSSGPVITWKTELSPPIVSVAMLDVSKLAEDICCTHTVSPLLTVPLLAVNVPLQPME
jgi:hypothetical protein